VIGHWNFWPLPYRPTAHRNGAPIDDLLEPYELFDRVRALGMPSTGVIQLNHPYAESDLGRDLGFPRAIGLAVNRPLKRSYDGTGESLFYRNAGYDAQEVMNGTDNDHYLPYRAFWFYLLNEGVIRAGTANSDSHGLTDNVLGTPRNVVFTSATKARFDARVFNADVKQGKIVGTNGPVIEIWTTAIDGSTRAPSIEKLVPRADATLELEVRAAPWVPIDEVRIVVGGRVVETITELAEPEDPFGSEGVVRYRGSFELAALLPPDQRDTWLIVEAGAPLLVAGDLDCDGVPDTGDNNGDGVIDWRDVDRDEPIDEAPPCDEDADIGPLPKAPAPERGARGYHFAAVTPGGYPLAFTNPLLFDRDGDGK
jgi:hypothetical protein